MKRITTFLILCILAAAMPCVSASGGVTGSLSIVKADKTEVLGKLSPGTSFMVGGSFTNNENKPVKYSVYCGVYAGDRLYAVYKGDTNTLETLGTADGYCGAQIPENIPYLNYYIKAFALSEESMRPLCPALSYDASGAYETERYTNINDDNKIVYTGREMLKNGSMEYENQYADGWDPRGDSQICKSSEYTVDGVGSCLVTKRKYSYDSITQDITEQLKKNGSGWYRVRGSVRSTVEGVNYQCIVRITHPGGDRNREDDNKFTTGKNMGWLPEIKKDKWYSFDKTAYIEVPKDMVKAEIYIEGGTNDNFYVDKCSMKPVVTYEKFLADNTPEENRIEKIKSETGETVIHPKESNERLINPYKGLVCYQFKNSYADILSQPAGECAGVVYTRFGWNALEPKRGVYNFKLIKDNLELLKNSGKMLGIGIAHTVNYNSPSSWTQETPDWLFNECGAQYVTEFAGTDHALKVPVFNDPVFLEEYSKLIDAFAEEFKDYTNIAYVDMRSYGNWGEWHWGSLSQSKNKSKSYTDTDLNNFVDVYKNVRAPLMMFTSQPVQLSYALNTYGTGIRVDGTMNPKLANNHRRLAAADGINAAVAEWFDQPSSFYKAGTYNGKTYPDGKWSDYYEYMPVMMEKTVKEGKASYMAMGYWNPTEFYACFTDLCERLANKTGYWFKPVKIAYTPGSSGTFNMTIKNDGYTRLYAGYKRNACVKLALADADGNVMESRVLNGINPENWKTGEYSFETAAYEFSGTNGGKLMLGVFSDADKENPDIKLGIDCPSYNGWYDLENCSQIGNISDNKLYTEKSAYADNNYGYRSPMYAFDKNTNTFWACEGVKDSYLDIDFGEQEKASSLIFTAECPQDMKISVTVWDDGKQISLKKGISVKNGENVIDFDERYINRLRVSVDENAGGTLKIYEMTVK